MHTKMNGDLQTGRSWLRKWRTAGLAAGGLAVLLCGGCEEPGGRRTYDSSAGYHRSGSAPTMQPRYVAGGVQAAATAAVGPVGPAEPTAMAAVLPGTAIAPVAPDTNTTAGRMELRNRRRWRDEDCLRGEDRRERAAVNLWTDALDDPRSTFGLDVDTASMAIARSYLRRGALPPPETIRTEEMVNAFDYRDPARPEQTFTINAEMTPTPFAPKSYLLRIGLRARPVSSEQRKPARLTFVVDVSGSMAAENRLPLVRRALHDLVDRLRADDRVAIVVFSNRAEVFLNPTPVRDKTTIHHVIDNLQIGGATSIEDGLKLGYEVASRAVDPRAMNRVILCSDGEANVGTTAPEAMLAEVARQRQQGIYLSTVGFGMGDYNDATLETLADKGNGNYDHIDRIDEADRVFGDKLTSLLEVVAKDAKIQVEFNPDRVAEYRLLGYENRAIADRDFRNDRVDAGEVGAGTAVTALYELTLLDGPRTAARGAAEGRAMVDAAVDALVQTPPPAPAKTATPAEADGATSPAPEPEAPAAPANRQMDTTLPAATQLATIRIRYKEPGDARQEVGRRYRREEDLHAERHERVLESSFTLTEAVIEPKLSRASADLRLAMAAAQFSELLRGSPYAARQDIDAVLALLRSVEQDRRDDDRVLDLYDMALSYKQLCGEPRLSRR